MIQWTRINSQTHQMLNIKTINNSHAHNILKTVLAVCEMRLHILETVLC